jgi:hypothetical protein
MLESQELCAPLALRTTLRTSHKTTYHKLFYATFPRAEGA